MEIYVKISLISTFSLSGFPLILSYTVYIDFADVTASNTATDVVTN